MNRSRPKNMLSFEQLIQNLTDTTQPSIVRSSAIAGLATQGSPHGVKLLIEALADLDSMIRREAAKALQDLDAYKCYGASSPRVANGVE